ncbi:MATE family efflux transporter [Salinirarus marinus]|uniref:MATE family efflux transporter n=1 Tax=Salinirarus marinus TaxID=3068310 RepID=UPI003C6BDD55
MNPRTLLDRVFKGRDEVDLTSGDIGGPLFYLALPIVITNLLQTAYNLADTFWVGQYSTNALAAISFAFPLVFLLIALGMGVSVAGSVLVAQFVGADEEREAEYAASQTVGYAFLLSLVLGAGGYLFVEDVIGLLGAEPDVLPLATDYMQIISLGIVFMFGFFVFISLMRGYGDTITPMLVMFGSVVLNIAIDPFVIFGWWVFPEMGVEGAALATVFSRALAMAVGLGIMLSGRRGVRIRPGEMFPDLAYGRKLARVGLPASVEGTGRALSINLLMAIVGTFPTTVVAAFGIGTRVFSVIFLPAIGVARGVETMAGQNIGAGEENRAGETATFAAKATFVILAAVGVVVWVFAGPIIGVFTDNPDVVAVGADFLRYVAPTFGFIGVMRSYSGAFRGAGKTLTAAAISILMLGVIRLPFAWVAAEPLGSSGVWLSFTVSNIAGAAIAYLWFQRGTWRSADLTGTKHEDAVDGVVDD